MQLTPNYIVQEDFRDLEAFFLAQPHAPVSFRQGEYLWAPDEPFHRIFYLMEGVAETFMEHESGRRRILSFHAGGTVYPMFHYKQYKLENGLLCRAMTHIKALSFTQEQFARMFESSETLRRHVIDGFSSETNLLLYELGHQEQNDSYAKLCNLLYLLLAGEHRKQNYLPALTQEDLADLLGISLNNVTRSLAKLRENGIIETGRKTIAVVNPAALAALCSGETL